MIVVNRKKVSMTSILATIRSKRASVTARVRISVSSRTISKMTMKNSRTEKLLMITIRKANLWARNQLPPNKWFSVMANQILKIRKRIRMAWCTKKIWKTTNSKIMKDKSWIRRPCITLPSKMTSLSIGPRLSRMWVPLYLILMNQANFIKKFSSQ